MSWEEICEHVLSKLPTKNFLEKNHPSFRKWFMKRESLGYSLDPLTILRCYFITQELENKLDHFVVIGGREGLGKSTLSFMIAAWVNPSFNLDNVCYGAKEYLNILKKKANIKKEDLTDENMFESIVLDEGTELLSREALNVTNRVLTKTFFVQRALGFLVIVNIPNFHMLDSVIRLHRVRTLIQVLSRGTHKVMTGYAIKKIAKEGQISKSVTSVQIPVGSFWHGRFRKDFPPLIDREGYEDAKMVSIKEMLDEMDEDLTQKKMVSAGKVAKEIGCQTATVVSMIKRQEVEGKMIGGKWYLTKRARDKLITV